MKKLAKIAGCAAMLSLTHAGAIQAAETQKCLSTAQAEALVTYLLPVAVKAGQSQCTDSLPANAYLLEENSEQLARYEASAENAWPDAKEAIGIISGEKLSADFPDEFLKPIAGIMMTKMIGEDIKPSDCVLIDKIFTAIEPMPSSNVASLTITIVKEATKNDEDQDIPICKAPA